MATKADKSQMNTPEISDINQDPFYHLTSNIPDASVEESEEILEKIAALSAEDLSISSSKQFTISKDLK